MSEVRPVFSAPRAFWLLYFFNAIGSWSSWILLAPHYSAGSDRVAGFAVIAITRQILFMLGTLYAGPWADHGNTLRKLIRAETLLTLVTLVALGVLLVTRGEPHKAWLVGWVVLRVFVGAFASVAAFKLITLLKGIQEEGARGGAGTIAGESIVIHLLAIQGSVVFASALCAVLSVVSSHAFVLGVAIDLLSSIGFLILLLRMKGSAIDRSVGAAGTLTFLRMLKESAITFWGREFWPLNAIQFIGLIMISGFATMTLHLSKQWSEIAGVSSSTLFSVGNLVYGSTLWLGGYWVGSLNRSRSACVVGTAAVLGSSALWLLAVPLEVRSAVLDASAFALYSIGFGLFFQGSNRLIIERGDPDRLATLRASMTLQLSVVFGVAEYWIGSSLHLAGAWEAVHWVRVVLGVGVLGWVFGSKSLRTVKA